MSDSTSAVSWPYVRPAVVHLTNGSTAATLLILAEPLSRKRPADLMAELAGLYALGLTCDEIAGAIRIDGRRVTETAVNRWLRRAGVVLRRNARRRLAPHLAKQAHRRVLARGRARKAAEA